MKPMRSLVVVLLAAALAQLACATLAPNRNTPPAETPQSVLPANTGSPAPTTAPTAQPTTAPTVEPPTATPAATSTPAPTSAPTAEPLRLEVLQTQAWTDRLGHVRVNLLFRNPYDFPVVPSVGSSVSLRNSAGALIRARDPYFLDGISGGGGFVLPGETIAANACFTCETTPLSEEWASVEVLPNVKDATGTWNYVTDVSVTLGNVAWDDGPIFDVSGTVTNNTDGPVQRISARVFVYAADGTLIGAAEASAWDVAAGATANFDGYGFGEAPSGPVEYEVTAVGVNY